MIGSGLAEKEFGETITVGEGSDQYQYIKYVRGATQEDRGDREVREDRKDRKSQPLGQHQTQQVDEWKESSARLKKALEKLQKYINDES